MTSGRAAGKVTIYDIAKRVGMSSSTVSRVLTGRGQIAPATRALVHAAAAELDYRPNTVARNLSTQASDTIAILLPDITNPFFPQLVSTIQAQAEQRGLTVLLCNTHNDPDSERRYLDALLSRQVEHVMCAGLALDAPTIEEYAAAGLTFIGIDRAVGIEDSYLVESDNRCGAYIGVRHLLDLGHRRIAHLTGPAALEVSAIRHQGYLDALAEAGIPPEEALIVSGDFTEESGAAAFRELRDRAGGETAIFAANDLMAIGAAFAAHEHRMDIPGELSIVGFDDVPLTKYVSPQLTTVRQDIAALGAAAVEIATSSDGAERPPRVSPPSTLVVRHSTSHPRIAGGHRLQAPAIKMCTR